MEKKNLNEKKNFTRELLLPKFTSLIFMKEEWNYESG